MELYVVRASLNLSARVVIKSSIYFCEKYRNQIVTLTIWSIFSESLPEGTDGAEELGTL